MNLQVQVDPAQKTNVHLGELVISWHAE